MRPDDFFIEQVDPLMPDTERRFDMNMVLMP